MNAGKWHIFCLVNRRRPLAGGMGDQLFPCVQGTPRSGGKGDSPGSFKTVCHAN